MFGKFKEFFGGSTPEKKKRENPQTLIRQFVDGSIGPTELCKRLEPNQGEEFEQTFEALKDNLEAQPGVNQFKINQLENLIKRGIEQKICEAHNIPYIKRVA